MDIFFSSVVRRYRTGLAGVYRRNRYSSVERIVVIPSHLQTDESMAEYLFKRGIPVTDTAVLPLYLEHIVEAVPDSTSTRFDVFQEELEETVTRKRGQTIRNQTLKRKIDEARMALFSLADEYKHSRTQQRLQRMADFIRRFGFLSVPPSALHETYTEFWNEAIFIYLLWQRLAQAKRRDLEAMQQWITFIGEEGKPEQIHGEYLLEFLPFAFSDGVGNPNAVSGLTCRVTRLPQSKEEHARLFQSAALYAIAHAIGYVIAPPHNTSKPRVLVSVSNPRVQFSTLKRNPEDDVFVEYVLQPATLAQAMICDLFNRLQDPSLRVCEVCGRLFRVIPGWSHTKAPEVLAQWGDERPRMQRTSNKYCSDACGSRARKRRYDARRRATRNEEMQL